MADKQGVLFALIIVAFFVIPPAVGYGIFTGLQPTDFWQTLVALLAALLIAAGVACGEVVLLIMIG